jgi:hypothetical protein
VYHENKSSFFDTCSHHARLFGVRLRHRGGDQLAGVIRRRHRRQLHQFHAQGNGRAGSGGSDNFGLRHGFWQEFEGGGFICDCVPGEANETPPVNILDIVYLINFKYKSGPSPVPYALCNGDPNTDCTVNILDIVYLINFKYKTGPAPKSCEQWVADCGLPLRK